MARDNGDDDGDDEDERFTLLPPPPAAEASAASSMSVPITKTVVDFIRADRRTDAIRSLLDALAILFKNGTREASTKVN